MSGENVEIRSFLLTISTKTDIEELCWRTITDYVVKSCDFYHVVLERGDSGKLHLHAIMLYDKPQQYRTLRNNMWTRRVQPFHKDDGSIGKFAVKLQAAPGSDWYDEYLRKEEGVQVLATKWDGDHVADYFPTAEQQQVLQDLARKGSPDGWIATHLDDFKSSIEDGVYTWAKSYAYCLRWYFDHKRDPNTRVLRERARFLWQFANNDFKPRQCDNFMNKEEYETYGEDLQRRWREYKRQRVD